MALSVKHTFVCALPDDPADVAAGFVVPTNWNANHTLTGVASAAQGGFGVDVSASTGIPSFAAGVVTFGNVTLTGDVTGSGAPSIATTLATVNGNVGSFGSATQAGTFTVNGKGLITAAASVTITPAIGSITGLGTGVAAALAVNIGTAGAFVVNGGALGSPSSVGTMPAFTLGGTVSGGGQQVNNVIIGTVTPLAGAFTTISATTSAVVGNASAITLSAGVIPAIQNHTTAATAICSFRWSNDAGGAQLINAKSRGATVGTHVTVQNGDTLANNQYYASDGTGFILAGAIRCEADGVPATNVMFGRILFLTNQGGTAVTEAMRVTSTGGVNVGAFTADPGTGSLNVVTKAIVPLVIGGSVAGSTLTLESTSGAGTTDSILFKTGSQATRMTILSGGKIGVGTETNPQGTLVVSQNTATGLSSVAGTPTIILAGADSVATNATFQAYGNVAGGFFFTQASGTGASPAATQAGQTIGILGFVGFNPTGLVYTAAKARIASVATDTFTNTAQGASLLFDITPSGSTTRSTVMTITGASGSNRIGIGTETNPQTTFVVSSNVTTGLTPTAGGIYVVSQDNTQISVSVDSYGTGSGGANFIGRYARNTAAAPQAVQVGDQLGFFQGIGHDGSTFNVAEAAGFRVEASETWTTSAYGSRLTFYCTPTGTTGRVEVARFNPSGGLSIGATADPGIGSISAIGTLQVNNTAATTAINVVDINKDWSSSIATNILAAYTAYGDVARFAIRSSGGTRAGQTATVAGTIGVLTFRGWDTSVFATCGQISAVATETFSGAAHGTELRFSVTTSTTTVLVEGMRLQNSTGLSIGSTAVSTDPGAGNLLVQNFINTGGYARCTADVVVTSSTVLVDITGLTVTLSAGKTYAFQARAYLIAGAGGHQIAIAGTATATAIIGESYVMLGNALTAQTRFSTITTVSSVVAGGNPLVSVEGTITVNAGGTFKLQVAQNGSNAASTTAKTGSWLKVWQIT